MGLFYNGELVSIMTFSKLEGRKVLGENEWNLSRFCNKLGTNVVGGASKLLKNFIKEYSVSRIISYADNDWSDGNIYYKLNFNLINKTRPDYKWIVDGIRKHKQNYKKSKLKIVDDVTEANHMNSLGYYKVWDCGKLKFELKLI